jgi:molybdopterin converting factor small subunit
MGPRKRSVWSGARGPRDKERLIMANKILIPTPLRPFTGKQDAVEVDGATIGELLANLTTQYAGLKPHLYNEQGKLRSFVNVYLNDEDIRYLEKEKTAVKPGDTISIIPSVAGGNETQNLETGI